MTLNELYKKLYMDSPADLDYFEQYADLMEMDEELPFDLFYTALSEIGAETAGELTEQYFEELTQSIPDKEDELVSIVDSVEQNLLLLAADIDTLEVRRSFVQQLYKFREWYRRDGGAFIDGRPASVFEAVLSARAEALGNEGRRLDFSPSFGYELDDASYGIGTYTKIDVVNTGEDK